MQCAGEHERRQARGRARAGKLHPEPQAPSSAKPSCWSRTRARAGGGTGWAGAARRALRDVAVASEHFFGVVGGPHLPGRAGWGVSWTTSGAGRTWLESRWPDRCARRTSPWPACLPSVLHAPVLDCLQVLVQKVAHALLRQLRGKNSGCRSARHPARPASSGRHDVEARRGCLQGRAPHGRHGCRTCCRSLRRGRAAGGRQAGASVARRPAGRRRWKLR